MLVVLLPNDRVAVSSVRVAIPVDPGLSGVSTCDDFDAAFPLFVCQGAGVIGVLN